MTNFVRQPGNIAIQTEMHIRKLEQLLERETNPLKREMYMKILRKTISRLEQLGA